MHESGSSNPDSGADAMRAGNPALRGHRPAPDRGCLRRQIPVVSPGRCDKSRGFIIREKKFISIEMDFFDRTGPDRDPHGHGRTTRFDLIVIRGAPGVGKTTLAENLKKYFPGGVGIETDPLRNMIHCIEWSPSAGPYGSLQRSEEQAVHAIEAAWAIGRSYRANGYRPVLLVDTFTPPRYHKIESLIHESDPSLSWHIIALSCTDRELVSRLSRRMLLTRFTGRGRAFSDRDSAIRVNEGVRIHRYSNETVIDTTGRSPASVLSEALHVLQ